MIKSKQKRSRPTRKRKGDRLLNIDASASEIKCDYSIAPLDRLAIHMDMKWGVDSLPELVSPETAQKNGSIMAKLNAAIAANDPDRCLAIAQGCMRGLTAMDNEATASGQPQARPDVLEYELDGFKFGILPDDGHWPAAMQERPDLRLFTMREIAVTLKAMRIDRPLIDAVKNIPGAEITQIRQKVGKPHDDPIPF